MSEGYIDPHPGGDWSEEEKLTSLQTSKIARNQRLFAFAHMFNFTVGEVNNESVGTEIAHFFYLNTNQGSQLFATPQSSATVVKSSSRQTPPTMNDESHAQTSTDINNITAVAAHTSDSLVFGLDKDAGSSVGYLQRSMASAWTRLNRAAGASTDAAAVTSMTFAPPLNRLVACWNDQDIEYRTGGFGGTWTSAGNPGDVVSHLLWGETEFVGARSGTEKTAGYTSTDGITWVNAPFGMELPGNTLIAHDYSDDTWYAMGSDVSGDTIIVTTRSPATSWAQIPDVERPVITTGITSFVVVGGIIVTMSAQGVLAASPDLGQTWAVLGQFGSNAVLRKSGGRLFILSGAIYMSQSFFPPFAWTID